MRCSVCQDKIHEGLINKDEYGIETFICYKCLKNLIIR